MDKVTFDLYVSLLYLKQSIDELERILREEEKKVSEKKAVIKNHDN